MFFAFSVGGPYVMVQSHGYSATAYATAMMAIAFGWAAGTFTAARIAQRIGTQRMIRLGTSVTLVGGALCLALPLLATPTLLLFFAPMIVVALPLASP